ncbi:hypothetical protein MUP77_04250 [Candidatus Bathyarchaeota archaeon]|nr:hypothetical protein [Candidatus Bathyarchaeota archaeon]
MNFDDLIHVEGKNFIYCYKCGTRSPIPPRTQENLEYIRKVEAESDRIRYITPDAEGSVAFTRTIICPSCKNIMACRDQYTKIFLRNL